MLGENEYSANPLGGANHITRTDSSWAEPVKNVEPEKADPLDWRSFDEARALLEEVKRIGGTISLTHGGSTIRLEVEQRHAAIQHRISQLKPYILAVLRGELPARETEGDRTRIVVYL